MLKHRLIAGTTLAAGIGAVLLLDAQLAPYFPALLCCTLALGIIATRELVNLLPSPGRPPMLLCQLGVSVVLMSNWYPVALESLKLSPPDPWHPPLFAFSGFIILVLLREMRTYSDPGHCVVRVAQAVLIVGYLGLLPSFLIRQRWDLPPSVSGVALTLTIFVPKCCDIGAYFTGRLIGRTPFTPILSPKKTWEGVAGGLLSAIGIAVGLSYAANIFRGGWLEAALFGLVVGFAGILGDLAESLIKRDCFSKDADTTIPGFGGILDVIDSILLAAPVAYWWLTRPGG